jgi:hypothetical protein
MLVKRAVKSARRDESTSPVNSDEDAMRLEYGLSQGVRGKPRQGYRAGTNVVFLEPDLAAVFSDSASGNQALRLLVKLGADQGAGRGRPPKRLQPASRPKRQAKSKRRSRAARG